MEKKFKLGVIGAGFMASAIVKGIISAKILCPNDIIVSDIDEQSISKMLQLGVNTTLLNSEVCDNSEFVLLAVKPQSFFTVAQGIYNSKCKKFISIMAGLKKEKIKALLNNPSVARCMPNTPCSIGCGAVGIDCSDYQNSDDVSFIKGIFESFANIVIVPENMLDVVTAVSGSSPAYFYLFVKGIIDAGVKNGLSYEDAKTLAVSTMIGSGKMVFNNQDKSLDELISAVCSKGGTTIEAINTYNGLGLNDITSKAVEACIKRSRELENL